MSDLLVSGGRIVDGTGSPARPGDLLVSRGRIEAIGSPGAFDGAEFASRIDAGGRIVAPGFIDLHSHGDLILAMEEGERRRSLVAGRLAQGITTEIVGNCGLGPAPLDRAHEAALRGVLGWMTPEPFAWPWEGIGGYLGRLEEIGVPMNVGTLAAHGALRIAEAGLERRLPSSGSVGAMRAALRRALDEGAFGLSLGLIYPPGSFTPTDEILALAGILGEASALLTAHVRGSSETLLPAVSEILGIGRRSGARIHHSHSEAVGPDHWGKIPEVLRIESEARRDGVEVTWDMFPYTAAATTMAAIYPPWALEGGIASLLDRLRDPALRRRIRRDVETCRPEWPPWEPGGWAHNLVGAVGWSRITVGTVAGAADRSAEGMDLERLGAAMGLDPFDAVSDLMLAAEGNVSQIIHGISGEPGDDEGIRTLVAEPTGAFCTDANDTGRGRPHPAAYGAFPRVLGEWVRERGVITLEEAIRKMTGAPAGILGLRDRGILREGAAADLVVLDPAAVGSRATWEEPRRLADGVGSVLVNGRVAVRDGRILGGDAGMILRRKG